MALFFRKKVIIFAQGIGPIKNFFFRKITAFILKKCTYVTVRDEKSLFLLRSWGINPELVSDPVWNIELSTKYSHRGIGIQLRKWPALTNSMLKDFAKYIAEIYSDKIIFIYALQESLDLEICEQLEVELKAINSDLHTHVVTNRATFEIVEAFSHLDELIAMRYHACLLGLKYGIRVLPIIYDPKVEKLADEFDLTSRLMLYGEDEAESKIRNLRYGDYHIDNSKLKLKGLDFKPFEKVLFQ
jgi:polysaccharide pyruvyl transferase WcaK-like protein